MSLRDSPDRSTPEETRSAYESAPAVEEYGASASEAELLPAEEKILERYFTDRDARVLDLGCGAGRTTKVLDEVGFDVTGIDISERLVRKAADLFPDLDVRVGDAADLDYPDETFDYVLFSHGGLDYAHPEHNRLAALAEVRRVLKPGGLFAFSSHNHLFALPAVVFPGWEFVRTYYLNADNVGRLFHPYKVDRAEYDVETYLTNPLSQRRQLRDAGFEFVACVGKHDSPLRYFEYLPYYVACKSR